MFTNFTKLLGRDVDSLSTGEKAAFKRLVAAHRRLVREPAHKVNTKSEAGFSACAEFLAGIESTACSMRIDEAPRSYRAKFSTNYRSLFPDEQRNYRVDVLEACIEQRAIIWVNGDKFEFTAEAMRRAVALQRAWSDLSTLLERWNQGNSRSSPRPSRTELRNTLASLDLSWASFEEKYIAELIDIEEKARRLIVQAIEHERNLRMLEGHRGEGRKIQQLPDYQEERRRLVASIAHLNSVANFRRTGRDDLAVDVLSDAIATLQRCESAEKGDGQKTETLSADRILATDVVDSFTAVRCYLREVERCLERVDPHLCNNAGLVDCLVDWEESWEVGMRYMQNARLLEAVCGIVKEISAARQLAPALTSMCDDCDVELFMVISRIIWLGFLDKPEQYIELLRSLLPHRFDETENVQGAQSQGDPEVQSFLEKFRCVKALLEKSHAQGNGRLLCTVPVDKLAWEIFVKRVVNGSSHQEADDSYKCLAPGLRKEAQAAVEDLMRDLERWSIELQRHCPEDYNRCSAILVHCLTSGHPKQKDLQFRV